MNIDHRIHLLGRHLGEALVSEDAGVVHDDVHGPEAVQGGFHDPFAPYRGGHVVVVGHGLAAVVHHRHRAGAVVVGSGRLAAHHHVGHVHRAAAAGLGDGVAGSADTADSARYAPQAKKKRAPDLRAPASTNL